MGDIEFLDTTVSCIMKRQDLIECLSKCNESQRKELVVSQLPTASVVDNEDSFHQIYSAFPNNTRARQYTNRGNQLFIRPAHALYSEGNSFIIIRSPRSSRSGIPLTYFAG